MPERDPFLDDPIHREATDFLLGRMLDKTNHDGLQQHAHELRSDPLMWTLTEEKRSVVVNLAATRALEMVEDIFVMEMIL